MPRLNQASVASAPLQWSTQSVTQTAVTRFVIGRDSLGRWIVTDREDHVGGTFISEAAAFSFARQEADHDISQICRLPDGMVVEFSLH